MSGKLEMTFECNQDWEQMKAAGNGRHCERCCKTVHDFTHKSRAEILSVADGELCGMFLTVQIEPHLKPIELPGRLKAAMLTIGTVLGIELQTVQAQNLNESVKIENVVHDATTTVTNPSTTPKNHINPAKNEFKTTGPSKYSRTRLYFSRRFPFIVVKRLTRIGKFRAPKHLPD